jgi:hypothetical protein
LPKICALLVSACTQLKCDSPASYIVSGELADLVDRSLITQEHCAAPCWYGIVPGATSEIEMFESLEELDFIDKESLETTELADGGKMVQWGTVFPEDPGRSGRIIVSSEGVVSTITIYRLWYQTTLQEVIQIIGEPDGVVAEPYGLPDGPVECIDTSVIWFDKGLQVSLPSQSLSQANQAAFVEPQSQIETVFFFPSVSNLDEYLEIIGSPYLRDDFTPWKGFED